MNNFSIHDDLDKINRIIPEADALTEGKLAKKLGASLIAGSIAAHPGEPAKRPEVPAETDKTTVAELKEPGKDLPDTIIVSDGKPDIKSSASTVPDGIDDNVDTLNMGAVADTNGMWGTEAGRKFIDSLKRFYAGYGIIATFEHIRVNLHHVPKESISKLCVDPGSGDTLNTEYACTVNYPEQNKDVAASIYALYDNLRKEEYPEIGDRAMFAKPRNHGVIPGYDNALLTFNIYMDETLQHLQRKNILVHELKHCAIMYAVVQRMVSLFVRSPHGGDAMEDYAAWYGKHWQALNSMLNAYLDIESEQFIPDVEYVSRRDVIPFIERNQHLVPVRRR